MTDAAISAYERIVDLLGGNDRIPASELRQWTASGDIRLWALVCELLRVAETRIEPAPPPEEIADLMRRYFVRCIDENPRPGEYLHGGYEAAWDLAQYLKRWAILGLSAPIEATAADLAAIYARSDDAAKNRVICGVLEHAFEEPRIRPFFEHWSRDLDLRDAYRLATEWGVAHEK
ncbi:MAG TPA: hypothetical protein VEZ11_18445 [Thermoanaerobaculia bacterium]|nr:hypothetical protein [Thermoanaerobaculia bacterium]